MSTTKGNPSKTPIVAIRFTAGNDAVEDIPIVQHSGGRDSTSLSSSPSNTLGTSDDSNWRKEFLQGGFFSRSSAKRSGSNESLPAVGNTTVSSPPSISSTSTASESGTGSISTPSLGTWKLIKGRVSQAMEDIASSKQSSNQNKPQQPLATAAEADDSDADSATLNSSISDDFNEAAAHTGGGIRWMRGSSNANNADGDESDSDADLLDISFDSDAFVMKKSFDALRNAADASKRGGSLMDKIRAETAEWPNSVVRKRRSAASSSSCLHPAKESAKDVDIESGVEITEEMTMPMPSSSTKTDKPQATTSLPNDDTSDEDQFVDVVEDPPQSTSFPWWSAVLRLQDLPNKRFLVFCVLLFFGCWCLEVPPFVQGVLACLCSMSMVQAVWQFAQHHVARYFNDRIFGTDDPSDQKRKGPERMAFAMPDYAKMEPLVTGSGKSDPVDMMLPIVVEQHPAIKSYEGWMCVCHKYDPSNFHSSQTRPVFIRLDGSTLRLTRPAIGCRVRKRAIWNEPPIDVDLCDSHRRFELLAGSVEMCPRGLARKRLFSRKYPIQLVVKELLVSADDEMAVKLASPVRSVPTGAGSPSSANSEPNCGGGVAEDVDEEQRCFGDTIMYSNLQRLHLDQASGTASASAQLPRADDVHLLLFARTDREKEDWYRRFVAASRGCIADRMPSPIDVVGADMVFVHEDDCGGSGVVPDEQQPEEGASSSTRSSVGEESSETTAAVKSTSGSTVVEPTTLNNEGLLMSPSAARGPVDYVRFMGHYQQSRREHKKAQQEAAADDLWRGVDRTLANGNDPSNGHINGSGSIVWANVLAGRLLFSCLNDASLIGHIQTLLQRKLSAIKLPGFMEEIRIAHVHLGNRPPLIHRIATPRLDERGTWVDADVTYEGLMHMTITTKLNLLRLRRQTAAQENGQTVVGLPLSGEATGISDTVTTSPTADKEKDITNGADSGAEKRTPVKVGRRQVEALFDSDAESSGASSSESDESSAQPTATANGRNSHDTNGLSASVNEQSSGGGGSKKFLRIVDRIAASNLFQTAAEISYIQKAMENMSTAIKLRVELKGLVARCCINLPPPPSDRVWLGFRGPPRLWLSATPALGDHTVDWSIVTGAIESKLCDELTKYLVYPNMVDLIVPQLGGSTTDTDEKES